jgi:hypothetical protein
MRDILEVLKRLEAMARAGILSRTDANAAKRDVCANPEEYMTDEHWPATVRVLARRAVRNAGAGAYARRAAK